MTDLQKKQDVTGYSIGGKTGTAQKGKREDLKWIVSFIGFAPVDNPQVMVYVLIDEPDGTTGTSGTTSDTLILSHDILEELLPYMNIFKDARQSRWMQQTVKTKIQSALPFRIPMSG